MDIKGKITGIKYKLLLNNNLKEIDKNNFNINDAPTSCIIKDKSNVFGISKWVSPKRTRSYPFERVYNTLHLSKKITVIPIVKDEGAAGDRDYIQWDTVSLMSLLDVFVIFAYYDKAEQKSNKIKKQQFDNKYVISKINEIEQFHSSALHWNLNELNQNLHHILDKVKIAYNKIERNTGVKLHQSIGLDNFKEKIGKDVSLFMQFSRDKAVQAQSREYVTKQPKESLKTLTKSKITITNYLGGQYYLTVDEILLTKSKVSLIEGKHSKNAKLPSLNDIKDGLLKLILYNNLTSVTVDGKKRVSDSVLLLTSPKIKGNISTKSSIKEINSFLEINRFTKKQELLVKSIFKEAKQNKFVIKIQYSK